jgi:hypothetical protein
MGFSDFARNSIKNNTSLRKGILGKYFYDNSANKSILSDTQFNLEFHNKRRGNLYIKEKPLFSKDLIFVFLILMIFTLGIWLSKNVFGI